MPPEYRVQPLPNIFALGRNLALNLYRDHGFDNMAKAQRRAGQGLKLLKSLFRMKQPWIYDRFQSSHRIGHAATPLYVSSAL
jgi:hypothetical protein